MDDEIDAAYRTKYRRYAARHHRRNRQPGSASRDAQAGA
jgi:hypothetical protein